MASHFSNPLAEAEAVIAHLHTSTEIEKTRMAQTLHDDINGLMVGAAMDLTSVRLQLPSLPPELQTQLDRVHQTIQAAVDRSRQMTEELRPSILDNFGLFAALKWQLKRSSRNSAASCAEIFPAVEQEPSFEPRAASSIFRIAQEVLAMTFARLDVKHVDFHLEVEDDHVRMQLTHDGDFPSSDEHANQEALAFASMHHRIRSIEGRIEHARSVGGTTVFTAWIPVKQTDRASHNAAP